MKSGSRNELSSRLWLWKSNFDAVDVKIICAPHRYCPLSRWFECRYDSVLVAHDAFDWSVLAVFRAVSTKSRVVLFF